MLGALVIGQENRGPIPQAVFVRYPAQPGFLPGAQAEFS